MTSTKTITVCPAHFPWALCHQLSGASTQPPPSCCVPVIQVGVYHGPERNKSKTWLASQDVVITTYQTLAGDMGTVSTTHLCHVSDTSGTILILRD
jgi:hypothetical protein